MIKPILPENLQTIHKLFSAPVDIITDDVAMFKYASGSLKNGLGGCGTSFEHYNYKWNDAKIDIYTNDKGEMSKCIGLCLDVNYIELYAITQGLIYLVSAPTTYTFDVMHMMTDNWIAGNDSIVNHSFMLLY